MKEKPFTLKDLSKIESQILRQEIEVLKQEHSLEKENLLKDIARKLVSKNMAFPIIRDIIPLPEGELRGIFYGS